MDFLMVGSLSSYIKNLGLANKWKMKKNSGDFTNDEKKTELQRKNDMFKMTYMEQKKNEEKSETLTNIHNKINSGAKLTPDEMKYLQENDPQMYQKLKALEQEKKQFEKDLRRCKTKEDVERLKFSKVSAAMSAIGSVKNNSNIPDGSKLAIAAFEMRRLSEFDKISAKFVKSGEYDKLPTEAEKHKAESDLKKAEEAETEKILHKKPEEDDDKKTSENVSISKDEKNDEKISFSEKPENTEKAASDFKNADIEADTSEGELNITAPSVLDKKEISRIEAELTPEARKLKHAKAKAAYKKSILPNENPTSEIVFKGTMNSIG